jgi:hypothetical protein
MITIAVIIKEFTIIYLVHGIGYILGRRLWY